MQTVIFREGQNKLSCVTVWLRKANKFSREFNFVTIISITNKSHSKFLKLSAGTHKSYEALNICYVVAGIRFCLKYFNCWKMCYRKISVFINFVVLVVYFSLDSYSYCEVATHEDTN